MAGGPRRAFRQARGGCASLVVMEPSTSGSPPPTTGEPVRSAAPGPGPGELDEKQVALSFDETATLAVAEDIDRLFEKSTRQRYDVMEKVGEGRLGTVFRARDRRLGRVVALRRIRGELLNDTPQLIKLIEQVRALATLNHYNIVQVYDIDRDEAGHFITMEYVAGPTLARWVAEAGSRSLAEALELGRQLCSALGLAHRQGVVHGDIRPGNVLVGEDGVAKLVDFGLGWLIRDLPGRPEVGDPAKYAPPEVACGAQLPDAQADLYALAATLHFALTGRAPGESPETELPPPIRPVLHKALDRDPARRYASAEDLAAALGNIVVAAQTEVTPARLVACPQCGRQIASDVEFCGACGFALQRARQVTELLESARDLHYRGLDDQALRQYESVLELEPEHADARRAAADLRHRLERMTQLRAQANSLAATGALRKAIDAWRELLTVAPGDREATAQIRKCEEELQARQIVTLLTTARNDIKTYRFDTAEEKCAQVLRIDPHNAEATALKWLIPQARRQWLQGLMQAAVEAYRRQDYNLAHIRFSEAHAAGRSWASEQELQQIMEGMEMAQLVPALQELQRGPDGQSPVVALSQLNRLHERCTTARARQIIDRLRAQVEERYQAILAQQRREEEEAARRERAARARQRRTMIGVGIGVVILLVGPYVGVRQWQYRRLPQLAAAAVQQGDPAGAVEYLDSYAQLGGRRAGVQAVFEQLTAELQERLRDDPQFRDARRWAVVLASLAQAAPEGLLLELVGRTYARAIEQRQWREAITAVEQMARFGPATDEADADLRRRVDAIIGGLEAQSLETSLPEAWPSSLRAVEQSLAEDRPLARLATRETCRRLWWLQLDAALQQQAWAQAWQYARRLDQLDPNVLSGTARIRSFANGLPARAEAAGATGDLAAARRDLWAAAELRGEATAQTRPQWEALLERALTAGSWEEARLIAGDMDELYEGRPGRRRLEQAQQAALQRGRTAVRERRLADVGPALTGVLRLYGDSTAVVALLRDAIDLIVSPAQWDETFELVAGLEAAGPGRGIGEAGFDALLSRAVALRAADRAARAVPELDRLLPQHGQMRLRQLLEYSVLGRLRRELETPGRPPRREALKVLIALAPLLVSDEQAWAAFCAVPDAELRLAAQDAYCQARDAGDHETVHRLEQLNAALGATLDCPAPP